MAEAKSSSPAAAAAAAAAPKPDKDAQWSSDSDAESGRGVTLQAILKTGKVEQNGIVPIPLEDRKNTRFFNIFTVWAAINTNILGVSFGILGPLVYGLSLRDSALVILFFNLLSVILPAYLATFGPKTGMRQMIQARYSFGRYIVSVAVLCNLATMIGFTIFICIIGGQCLAVVSGGGLSLNVGIVIISVLSLIVSFWGFRLLHIFERYSAVLAAIIVIITTGYAGSGLTKQPAEPPVATARGVLNFGMAVASYQIPFGVLASDVTTYFDPKVPSWRVFAYTYAGLNIPNIIVMTLGAAFASAMPYNESWSKGYEAFEVGGLLGGVLEPGGVFGKIVLVLLSLTLLGNTCATFYSVTLNFQTLIPWLVHVPRYVFSFVVTGIMILVSILAVDNFTEALQNALSLIAYWSSTFIGIVIAEHIFFRGRDFSNYNPAHWDDASKLPLGVAALAAGICTIAAVVPLMDQNYWRGPAAATIGDIAFEMAFVISFIIYVPMRWVEKRLTGR